MGWVDKVMLDNRRCVVLKKFLRDVGMKGKDVDII